MELLNLIINVADIRTLLFVHLYNVPLLLVEQTMLFLFAQRNIISFFPVSNNVFVDGKTSQNIFNNVRTAVEIIAAWATT